MYTYDKDTGSLSINGHSYHASPSAMEQLAQTLHRSVQAVEDALKGIAIAWFYHAHTSGNVAPVRNLLNATGPDGKLLVTGSQRARLIALAEGTTGVNMPAIEGAKATPLPRMVNVAKDSSKKAYKCTLHRPLKRADLARVLVYLDEHGVPKGRASKAKEYTLDGAIEHLTKYLGRMSDDDKPSDGQLKAIMQHIRNVMHKDAPMPEPKDVPKTGTIKPISRKPRTRKAPAKKAA